MLDFEMYSFNMKRGHEITLSNIYIQELFPETPKVTEKAAQQNSEVIITFLPSKINVHFHILRHILEIQDYE